MPKICDFFYSSLQLLLYAYSVSCCTVFTLQFFENICLNCFSFPAHCSSCQFDLCDNCIKPYRSTYHPAHIMYKADSNLVYPGFNGGWRCDRCSRSFIPQMNNVPFHCSQCEFDLCDSCMKTTGDVSNRGKISNSSKLLYICTSLGKVSIHKFKNDK